MKTLLIAMALVGFTLGSGAQTYKHKTVQTKTRAVHHKVVRKSTTFVQDPVIINNDVTTKPEAPCVVYRKHNMVATECPGIFYDNSNINVNSENTYMGNYPKAPGSQQIINLDNQVDGTIAPQHNVISDYKGVAPADGNYCNNCRGK